MRELLLKYAMQIALAVTIMAVTYFIVLYIPSVVLGVNKPNKVIMIIIAMATLGWRKIFLKEKKVNGLKMGTRNNRSNKPRPEERASKK
jgi:hypothetical protein